MQIHRLLEIVYLLMNGAQTAGALARRFEVSPRTIYRDVEALSAAGIPVYMAKGRGGGISLMPGFVLGKAVLTEGEKADVLSLLRALGSVAPGEPGGALGKLSALFGAVNTDWIEVDFTSWRDPRGEAEAFRLLKSAILARRVVSFAYSSGRGETSSRTVEPLKLLFKGQAWYLYGYCRDRKDFRFFKTTRMRDIRLLDQGFQRDCPPSVLGEAVFQRGEVAPVTLRLSAQMAFRVYDEFDSFEREADGSFLVRSELPAGEGLFQYVASFGDSCEVVAPPELRAAVAERLEKTLARYQI